MTIGFTAGSPTPSWAFSRRLWPPRLAPDRDNCDGGERLMNVRGDNGAGEEQDCEGRSETSNGQEGVQGSHDGHSRVLRGTLYGHNGSRDLRVPACLFLSCEKPERCLNRSFSAAVREPAADSQRKQKRADSRGEPARSQCDQWEASGRVDIQRGNMGECLSCSNRSMRRNNERNGVLGTNAAHSQRPCHPPACRHRCRNDVLVIV